MIRLNALKINVTTNGGPFSAVVRFQSGLNIIRGDNTTGKSTCLESVLYCLGLEELLGGRNQETMQSALKDELQEGTNRFAVTESIVSLEMTNQNETITVRRAIKSASRDPKLVELIRGPYLTNPAGKFLSQFMYVHDPGAATDIEYGFHAFLEGFIGMQLPLVEQFSGGERKLYLQNIFPAFFIEQKAGWSDFLATCPGFGIRNVKSRAIEFVLRLDVLENVKKRQMVAQAKTELIAGWRSQYEAFGRVAQKCTGRIVGLDRKPTTQLKKDEIRVLVFHDGKEVPLSERVTELRRELKRIEALPTSTAGVNAEKNATELNDVLSSIAAKSLQHDTLMRQIADETSRIATLNSQLRSLEGDLRKNKSALKVQEYGAQMKIAVAEKTCPTCHQNLKDFLLPQEIDQQPLGLEQNLSFLEEQKKMMLTYIQGVKSSLESAERQIASARDDLAVLRERARVLRQDLTSGIKEPSEADIEKKLHLRRSIAELSESVDTAAEYMDEFESLSRRWSDLLSQEASLPKKFFSDDDERKLAQLSSRFTELLVEFGYRSKSLSYVSISRDNYLPSVEALKLNSGKRDYDIRFDSSATDFIRSIWSFTCALYEVATPPNGNHPGFLVLDEPAQHSMANESMAALLRILESYKDAQVIVAASFNNSDEDFKAVTEGKHFNLCHITDRLVKREQ